MKYTYNVTGMTCNGCRASVEKQLNALPEITTVSVDLEKSEAIVEMSQHISTTQLQDALSKKYIVTEKVDSNIASLIVGDKRKSELKQLRPLFLIISYISITAVLLHYKKWNWSNFMLDFMGIFFIVFSFFKILDLKGFPNSFKMYDPLAKVIPLYGFIYPFVEVVLGLMFLMRFQIPTALIITIIVLGVTTVGVTKTLLDKKNIACACLGTALKLPMTKATFIENTIMIAMAMILLINAVNS